MGEKHHGPGPGRKDTGLYRDYIGILQGLIGDNGKENGSYYNGVI